MSRILWSILSWMQNQTTKGTFNFVSLYYIRWIDPFWLVKLLISFSHENIIRLWRFWRNFLLIQGRSFLLKATFHTRWIHSSVLIACSTKLFDCARSAFFIIESISYPQLANQILSHFNFYSSLTYWVINSLCSC